MIYFEFIKPISWTIRKTTKQYFEVLDDLFPVSHSMIVWVLPMDYFVHMGVPSVGLFGYRDDGVQILLAGKQPVNEYVDTLCHEFAHYLQYQEGKELKEAGVKIRAKTLNQLVQNELLLAV